MIGSDDVDFDYLTNLLNLRDFIIQGGEYVTTHPANYAVVAVDISNLKLLNDMYGMVGGDEVILHMAKYLFLENPSCKLACRIVGDQFRALIDIGNRTQEEEISHIISINQKLEALFSEKFPKVFLHIYTGLYFIDPKEDFDMRICIDKAHFAKKSIKGNFQVSCKVYVEQEAKDFTQNLELLRTFEYSCNNDGIVVFFQPKIDCKTNKLIGAEALCRMHDENGKLMTPGSFIPLLESNGMLCHLDEIMMEKTFSFIRRWLDEGRLTVPISLNMSRVNFYNEDIAKQVINLQKTYMIPPEFVEIEITETAFIEDLDVIKTAVDKLREAGFRISVDDFGSGYSSLGLLSSIPADIIKLDCSFARASLKTDKGVNIVRRIIQMLKEVDFDVICEGIETDNEKNLIIELGCDKIQGYLYDKPLPANEFESKYLSY